MSFLKKAKDLQPTRNIKFLLHNHLNGPQPARPLHRVHASSLTKPEGLCPRYYALHDVTKVKPKNEWITTSEQMTFAIGHQQQAQVIHWFADMGKAFCHWMCVACHHRHEFQLRPFKCETCGTKELKPEEVRFESADNGASCGIDILLALGEQRLRPVEIKTMGAEEFKQLKAPLAEHRLRTNLYLRLIAESSQSWSNMVATDKASILYITKGGYGCADPQLKAWGIKETYSPFKEFEVVRNDKETDELVKRAKVIKEFRAGKISMPCGVCPTAMSKRAMSCSMKAVCFSGDHPPEHDWS